MVHLLKVALFTKAPRQEQEVIAFVRNLLHPWCQSVSVVHSNTADHTNLDTSKVPDKDLAVTITMSVADYEALQGAFTTCGTCIIAKSVSLRSDWR